MSLAEIEAGELEELEAMDAEFEADLLDDGLGDADFLDETKWAQRQAAPAVETDPSGRIANTA